MRDLVEYVGFDAPISTILDRLEHRFRKSKWTDRLQHDFFQLAQEKRGGGAAVRRTIGKPV